MILRPATAEDAPAIVAIWNPVIRDTSATFTTLEKAVDGVAADIRVREEQGKAFLVAEEDGMLLGFATYFQFRSGPGYRFTMEHSVILGPQARGRGIGQALMTALEEHAHDAGVHSLFAGVSADNPAGLKFHAALGYEEVARLPEAGHKFGLWMDLVLMQKILRNRA